MLSQFEQQYEDRANAKLLTIQAEGFYLETLDNSHITDEFDNVAWIKNTYSNASVFPSFDYTIRGRIMANRRSGKSGFVEIQQDGERLQVYLRQDVMGEKNYAIYKLLDRGDIVQVSGRIFRTTQGELTLEAKSLYLLTKNFRPLPDKFNGLVDHEQCYRQRYVDLFVNKSTRDVFVTRSKIVNALREILTNDGFMEVETPILHSSPGGASAKPFATHHNALDQDLFMRIAPELYLKRLVVGGFDKVFELNRNFRNEGLSTKHNPEFTMLEYYQAYSNYIEAMINVQKIISDVIYKVNKTGQIAYQGKILDFDKWQTLDMRTAIFNEMKYYPGNKFCWNDNIHSEHPLWKYQIFDNPDWVKNIMLMLGLDNFISVDNGQNILTIFENLVEPKLFQPTIIYNFPKSVSPLAKTSAHNSNWVERFEMYVGGMEIGNAFSELTDPKDQLARFNSQTVADSDAVVDLDYVEALSYGMPPTVGVGIGIDRLVMLLTDQANIRDVILFPLLRKKD